MPIVLCRVDERLVHGQVVLGWGTQLRPSRYVIVDADLANAEWEQELYRLSLPDDTTIEFRSPLDAGERFAEWAASDIKTVVLFRDLGTVAEVAETGAFNGTAMNLGGIHHAPGRKEVLPFLHLEREDLACIRVLEDHGVQVTAQELPGSPKWAGGDLLKRGDRLWND